MRDICVAISQSRLAMAWPHPTGIAYTRKGDYVGLYGLEGSSDIVGVALGGRAIFIEVKTGSAKLGDHQKNFMVAVMLMGGAHFVARDIPSVIQWLQNLTLQYRLSHFGY